MLNLCDVLELIVNGFNNRTFPKQDSVIHRSESTFHVVFQLRNQLYSVDEKLVEKILPDIALVSDKFTIYKLNKGLHFQRFAVIDISGSYHEVEDFPFVVAYQMQLETVKPAEGAFPALCYPLEHLVHMDSLIPAHPQQRAVNEADAGTFAQQTLLDKDDELHYHRLLQFRETVVRNCLWEQMPVSHTNLIEIKVFQAFMI